MKKPTLLVIMLLLILIPGLSAQSEISLANLVEAVFESSAALEQSALRERLSELRRDSVFGAVVPNLTLNADPVYGLRSMRSPDPAAVPPAVVDTLTQSTGLSLSARQLLPTGGFLVGEIGSGLSATVIDPEGGDPSTSYSLSPSVSFSLSQPLFVDGSLVDVEQFSLNRENALLSVTSAETGTRAAREQLVATVVNLAVRRNALRRVVETQLLQQEILGQRLEEARIRQEQGQGSQQDLVSLQVQLNRLQDAELQSSLSARELELELARLSGVSIDENTDIAIPPPEASPVLPESQMGRPLSVLQAQVELQAARIEYALSQKQPLVTADVFLSLTPRYADERANPDTPAGAFTDYDGQGAGVDLNLGVNLSIPLSEGAARRRTVEQASIAVTLAESALQERENESQASRELNELRVETLRQRIALLQFDLEFEREQLESDLQLQELGTVTPFQVAQRRVSIRSGEIDLQNLRAELYLRELDRHRLGGGDMFLFVTGRQAGLE